MKKPIIFTPIKTKTKEVKKASVVLKAICASMKTRAHAFIPVLNILKFVPVKEDIEICTNGEVIFYYPPQILQQAKIKRLEYIERTLFHIMFHGLLGHFEQTKWRQRKLAWAMQDLQVHRYLNMLYQDGKYDWCPKDLLNNYIGDEIYYKGIKDKEFKKRVIRESNEYCCYENHATWSYSLKMINVQLGNGMLKPVDAEGFWKSARELIFGEEGEGAKLEALENLLEKENSERYGSSSARAENEVEYTYESSNSYKELLEKISSLAETTYEEQELDKTLYTYGLSLYEDVPLVEPEEISEKYCLNTLVIAVDTSGSCTHRAELFLRELIAVLEEIQKMGSIKHICYLECDTEITTQKDCYHLDEFIYFGKRHTFVGGGGTEFAPVFQYADGLVKEGEMVDALIYITDGMGCFPEYEDGPLYKVFLLLDVSDDSDLGWLTLDYVPDWADRIRLHKGDKRTGGLGWITP